MKRSKQKVTNKDNTQKENELLDDLKTKNESALFASLQKDSSQYDYKIINSSQNKELFKLDGLRKDFELPKYNMLTDKYLNSFFVSSTRVNQLVQSGLLKSEYHENMEAKLPPANNRMTESKYKCLSNSQQLSKECKVYIDKYLKNPRHNMNENDKIQSVQKIQPQSSSKLLQTQNLTNSINGKARNQIVSQRFQQDQVQQDSKYNSNNSQQNSRFFSSQSVQRKIMTISPISKESNKRYQNTKQNQNNIRDEELLENQLSPSKESQQNYCQIKEEKEIKQDNQINNINDNQSIYPDTQQINENKDEKALKNQNNINNQQSTQKIQHQQKNFKQFILKPPIKKYLPPLLNSPNEQMTARSNQQNAQVERKSLSLQKNIGQEVFYNQNQQKFTEYQKQQVIQTYNKDYQNRKKYISQESMARLYQTNQQKKEKLQDQNSIQSLSRKDFLEFLKRNNEKIRQKNQKSTSSSKLGSKKQLQTEEELEKKSAIINSKDNISKNPSQQQLNIESLTKIPERQDSQVKEQ